MATYLIFLMIVFGLMFLEKLIIAVQDRGNFKRNNLNQTFDNSKSKKINFVKVILIIFIFGFSAFRFNVGWDYMQYYNTIKFNLVTNIVSNDEYLTTYLVDLSTKTGMTNLYFVINSFICIYLISRTIKNYSNDYWLSIIFFICFPLFYLNSFSVIRIFSALAITFYGFRFIERRQFFRYVLIVLLASMFHKTAIIALVLYFIYNLKVKTSKLVIIFLSLSILSRMFNSIIIDYMPKYAIYTENTTNKEGTKAIIIFILLGIIALLLRNRITSEDKVANGYYNMYFFGLCIYLMFFSQGTMGHRLSLYGTIYSVLLIPKIVSIFKLEKERFFIKLAIYFISILMFLYTIYISAETYIPYKTIFTLIDE